MTNSRGMIGTLKKFDAEEHAKYDTMGKDALIKTLDSIPAFQKYKNIENPDQYGIDVLSLNENGEVAIAWEVEVRHGNWKGDRNFPFSEINCIERKDYIWRKDKPLFDHIPFPVTKNMKTVYVQMNDVCSRAVIIEGESILKNKRVPWANRKASNEYVRQVSISQTFEIKLK